MKTTTQFFIVFIFCFTLSCGKDSFGQLKNSGIKGGLNLSGASFDNSILDDNTKTKTGFNIGIFYDFLNFKNIAISGEADFSQKGFETEIISSDDTGNITPGETIQYTLNYIDVDVLSRFFANTKNVNPYFSVGPVLGFNVGHSVNELVNNLKSPSFGMIFGVGAEIKNLIPVSLIAEVRYNLDLTVSYENEFSKYRNQLFEFNLGIRF